MSLKQHCNILRLYSEQSIYLDIMETPNLHQTAEVSQVIDEVKQLADVVCYRRAVGVHPL